jgi:hypothetical protein
MGAFVCVYANIAGHWSAYQAARAGRGDGPVARVEVAVHDAHGSSERWYWSAALGPVAGAGDVPRHGHAEVGERDDGVRDEVIPPGEAGDRDLAIRAAAAHDGQAHDGLVQAWGWERWSNLADFDRYAEEHAIAPAEQPAAFAAWLFETCGWDGEVARVDGPAPGG